MKKLHLLIGLYLLTMVITITGALLKILHYPAGESLLIAGLVATLVFVVVALQEVFASRKIDLSVKLLWAVGLVFFNSIAGFVYLVVGRKKVVTDEVREL